MKITTEFSLTFTVKSAQQYEEFQDIFGELFRGAQAGAFVQDEENLAYFNCPNATMTRQADAFYNLIKAVKTFAISLDPNDEELQNMECEDCDGYLQTAALIVSTVISYEGT